MYGRWLLERSSRPLETSGLEGADVYSGQGYYLNSVVQCLGSW